MLEGPDGQVEHTAAQGNGPVNALDGALRKALSKFYPEVEQVRLLDYKVRVLGGARGHGRRRPRADRVGRRARALGHGRRLAERDRGQLAGPGRCDGLQAVPIAPRSRSPPRRAAGPGGLMIRVYARPQRDRPAAPRSPGRDAGRPRRARQRVERAPGGRPGTPPGRGGPRRGRRADRRRARGDRLHERRDRGQQPGAARSRTPRADRHDGHRARVRPRNGTGARGHGDGRPWTRTGG